MQVIWPKCSFFDNRYSGLAPWFNMKFKKIMKNTQFLLLGNHGHKDESSQPHGPLRALSPSFWPSGATKHWKNTVFRDFPTFSRTCIFSLLTFSISDLLPSDFLHVRVSSWLCFFLAVISSVHFVGTLVSKLHSIMTIYCYYWLWIRIIMDVIIY